jgi:hypothetical protein
MVMDNRNLVEIHANYCDKAWCILYSNIHVMKKIHGYLKFG